MSNVEEKTTLKKLKTKFIIAGVILLVIVAIAGGIFLKGYFAAKANYETKIEELEQQIVKLEDEAARYIVEEKVVSVTILEKEIKAIGELATQQYSYTDAGSFTDSRHFKNLNIPLTKKHFVLRWDGVIKAGIDIQKVIVEVNDKDKLITIKMPEAKILSHELDANSFETLKEDNNIFNPITIDDVRNFDAKSKSLMEERAIESGLLDKAYENAKLVITSLVYTEVVEAQGYSIEFEKIK